MRGARGQAAPDYLAVVLLVGLALAGAGAVVASTGLGERVVAAMRRALCVVAGGACEDPVAERPCVRVSTEQAHERSLTLLAARVGSRSVQLRERRSDGTVAVTLTDERSIGADFGTGADLHYRWGESGHAFGAELRAAVLAEHAGGRTWIVPDEAAAARLVARVRLADLSRPPERTIAVPDQAAMPVPHRLVTTAPPPRITFSEAGPRASADFHRLGRSLHVAAGEAYGERVDHVSGERTLYVRHVGSAAGALSIANVGVDGAGEVEERYGITVDRAGRPLDLEVLAARDVQGAVELPRRLAAAAGLLRVPTSGEQHVETEQHLDLTEPANAEIARAFLGGLGSGSLAVEATTGALRARLERDGVTRVRAYAREATAHEIGGHAKVLGAGVGGEGGSSEERSRLLRAAMREAGGPWRADEACLPLA